MNLEELELRIKRLEDIEEIRNLHAALVYGHDSGTWQAVADLFVEDAVCDFGPFGHPEGKKAIGEHFNMERTRMPFRLHLLHNPVIKLDVDKAKGKWSFQAYVTQASTNRAIEVAGEYNCDYVRTKVGWKFKVCACRFHYITPYDEGWVKSNLAEF
jgi:hypothetical protein